MIIWIKRVKLDVSPSLLRHYLCLYFKFIQLNVLLLIFSDSFDYKILIVIFFIDYYYCHYYGTIVIIY